jgi:hypothetical protein
VINLKKQKLIAVDKATSLRDKHLKMKVHGLQVGGFARGW